MGYVYKAKKKRTNYKRENLRRKVIHRDKWWFYIVILLLLLFILSICYYFRTDIVKIYKFSYRDTYGKNLGDDKINELRDNLNINDLIYDWGEELVYDNKPKEIIYHHSASSSWSPEDIHSFHKEKGWSGIGYHFYIRKDGSIYRGRPEKAEGAHTKGKNKESIGICLEGNFEEERLTIEQVESLYQLSVYISLKYDIGNIVGHREEGSTLCPGENFPVKSIRDKVIGEIENFDVKENKITHLLE